MSNLGEETPPATCHLPLATRNPQFATRPPPMHPRLLRLAREKSLPLTLTILSELGIGLLIVGQARLISAVINHVFLDGQTLAQVTSLLAWMVAVIAARGILAWLSEVSAKAIAIGIKNDLRTRLLAHIERLGPAYVKGERTGELATTAVEGIEILDAYFSQYVPQLILAVLIPITLLVFVFPLDALSGVVLLVTAPMIPVFMYLVGKTAEALTKKQYKTLSRLAAHFFDSIQGLRTLKEFGRAKAHTESISQASNEFRDATLKVLRVTFLSALVLELVATVSTAVVAVEIGLRLLYFRIGFEQALFLLIIAPEFYIPMRMLGVRFHAGMDGVGAATRIFEILDKKPVNSNQLSVNSNQLSVNSEQSSVSSGQLSVSDGEFSLRKLQFDKVSYTYPDGEKPALEDVSLTIRAGEKVALVGKSGAGKSTLLQLVLGFLAPTEGKFLINERDAEEIPPDQWREQIAWVPQRPYIFHDTIAANIALARPNASPGDIRKAAQAAQLDDFIQSLPQGYQTVVGEGGARLSGGEAQRLALARAFLKDAPLLILDEPTSNLDPRLETKLVAATRALAEGRTTITIAHRLNTVYQADRIYVLNRGKLAQAGSHDKLAIQDGLYRELIDAPRQGNVHLAQNRELQEKSLKAGIRPRPPQRQKPDSVHTSPKKHPRILWRLFKFLRGSWGQVALSVFLGAVTIGSSVALMGTSAWLIATAALHPSIAALNVAIVGVRFFGITRGVARYAERLTSHEVTFRLLARLRTWFYAALEPLSPARLMTYKGGDLLSHVMADVETLEDFYVRVVGPPFVGLLVGAGAVSFVGWFSPWGGVTLGVFLAGVGVLGPLVTRIISRRTGQSLVKSRARLQAQIVDNVQGQADLIVYGRSKAHRHAISEASAGYGKLQMRMSQITGLNTTLSTWATNLAAWGVLALTIPLVRAGRVEGVMLAPLVLIALAAFEAVTPLPLAAQTLAGVTKAAQRLFEVVDTEPTVVDPVEPRPTPEKYDIVFQDLSFSYGKTLQDVSRNGISVQNGILPNDLPNRPTGGSNLPALHEVNFEVREGQSLAVVGPSGAGKSTLLNLLLRFWEFEEGKILLGGQPLSDYTQKDVREKISVISQRSYFFNTTLSENLRLANPGASQREIEEAAAQAQIHDFISSLPLGYETLIGEQGTRLSGGEHQRLAIARAILKNAPILLLDEPTANLDTLTERRILKTLFALMKERTSLLITHRLVGLENVDEILVLDRGRIVERGTHSELLANKGLYWKMLGLQERVMSENET